MTDLVSVVPAKAGTHTAESIGGCQMAVGLCNNNVLWLWVPGRARLPGTTVMS